MRNYTFAFYVSEKILSNNWAKTISRGAAVHGDKVYIEKQIDFNDVIPPQYEGGGNIGLAKACKRIMGAYLKAGRHFMFFDKGYWGRNIYWRVSIDGWQPNKYFRRFARSTDRLEQLEKRLGEFTYQELFSADAEAPILFAGSCQNYATFADLGNVNDYNLWVLQQLRANTKRPLIYRPNPSWYLKHNDEFRPIHEEVKKTSLSVGGTFVTAVDKCHLMVTHGTGAAVTATQLGIPAMVLGEGVAKSISLGDDFTKIEQPVFPKHKDRWQFYADLAYCQWTTAEFESGEAWQEIRDILSFLEGRQEPPSVIDITRQYQVMHKSQKYFRGLGTVNYRDEILALIHSTASTTILDYGSGKGEQYEDPYELDKFWGVTVTCYDPGLPEFPPPTKKEFDGVICCDVLEHIPEHAVDAILTDIFKYAKKFVFFVITTVPAKKFLPDGRNCHVTIRDEKWWRQQIEKAAKGKKFALITKGDDGEGE